MNVQRKYHKCILLLLISYCALSSGKEEAGGNAAEQVCFFNIKLLSTVCFFNIELLSHKAVVVITWCPSLSLESRARMFANLRREWIIIRDWESIVMPTNKR